jgi:hypothetical protein
MTPQDNLIIVAAIPDDRVVPLRALLATMTLPGFAGTANPANAIFPFGEFDTIHFARLATTAPPCSCDCNSLGGPSNCPNDGCFRTGQGPARLGRRRPGCRDRSAHHHAELGLQRIDCPACDWRRVEDQMLIAEVEWSPSRTSMSPIGTSVGLLPSRLLGKVVVARLDPNNEAFLRCSPTFWIVPSTSANFSTSAT